MTVDGREHQQWEDATGAYVLGALPDEERVGFAAHVAVCADCREELAALRVAADALPLSVTPVGPPPELKTRIMGEVEREARLLAAAGDSADRPPAARRARRARPFWLLRGGGLAGLAAAAALVVVLVTRADHGSSTFPATMDRAQVSSAAHGELRVRDGSATLVLAGLRAPQAGRVYQVWIKRRGRAPEPTDALFVPRSDGSAATGVPAKLRHGDAVLVTSEPAGGSSTPTRAPLLSASPS